MRTVACVRMYKCEARHITSKTNVYNLQQTQNPFPSKIATKVSQVNRYEESVAADAAAAVEKVVAVVVKVAGLLDAAAVVASAAVLPKGAVDTTADWECAKQIRFGTAVLQELEAVEEAHSAARSQPTIAL